MNLKPHYLPVTLVCFLFFSSLAFAQEKLKKPQMLITERKTISGKLKISEGELIKVIGSAVFKVTQCNADKTLTGELTFQIEESSRKQLEEKSRKPFLSAITLQNVIADFAKETECPVLKLEFQAIDSSRSGELLHLDRFTLDLKESKQDVSRILCYYVSCKIECRQVRRINELLFGFADK